MGGHLVTRLCETRVPLYRRMQKDSHSNHLHLQVGSNLTGGCCGNSEVQGSLGDEIDQERNRLVREKSQVQSGTRAVATVLGDRNCGCWADVDDLYHDLCLCLDRGQSLDLYVGHCRGDHARGQRSTDLSAPDSYGTQPCGRRQRHLVRTEVEVCAKGESPWEKTGLEYHDE